MIQCNTALRSATVMVCPILSHYLILTLILETTVALDAREAAAQVMP